MSKDPSVMLAVQAASASISNTAFQPSSSVLLSRHTSNTVALLSQNSPNKISTSAVLSYISMTVCQYDTRQVYKHCSSSQSEKDALLSIMDLIYKNTNTGLT